MYKTLRSALLVTALGLAIGAEALASPGQAIGKLCKGGQCTSLPPEAVVVLVVATTLADVAKAHRCKTRGLKIYCKGRRK